MNQTNTFIRCLSALTLALGLFAVAPASAQDVEEEVASVEDDHDASARSDVGALVDLNTATESQLIDLPGIGPSKARAILAYREQRAFRRVEELMRVRGIGRGTFRQLRPLVTVRAAAQPSTPTRSRSTRRASR